MAAGAVVPPGTVIPTGQVWAGNPARKLRDMQPGEAEFLLESAVNYAAMAALHAEENSKSFYDIEVGLCYSSLVVWGCTVGFARAKYGCSSWLGGGRLVDLGREGGCGSGGGGG